MGLKWVQKWVWFAPKNPLLTHFWTHFSPLTKTHLISTFSGKKLFPPKKKPVMGVSRSQAVASTSSREFLLVFFDGVGMPGLPLDLSGHCLGALSPHNLSEKYWQYTSNLYRSTPAICNAVPFWQRNAAIRFLVVPQYASYLYHGTPPICTGNTFEK